MQLYLTNSESDFNRKAANIISAQIIMKPSCVLGLATGSTPQGAYKQLVEWYCKGDVDFAKVRTVNLDEYKDISRNNPNSYYTFMQNNLFSHVNINQNNIYLPNGMAEDSKAECLRYNGIIESLGGIDLLLLGIGENGHIGFNEPGDTFEKEVHLVELTESTKKANSRFFTSLNEVPSYAYTIGMKTIMQAKSILLIAFGEKKANALIHAFYGTITPSLPASILQLHNNVTVVADSAAAKFLK